MVMERGPFTCGPIAYLSVLALTTRPAGLTDFRHHLAGPSITGEPSDGAALHRLAASLPGPQHDWLPVMPHQPTVLGLDAASARQVFALLGDLSAADRLALG